MEADPETPACMVLCFEAAADEGHRNGERTLCLAQVGAAGEFVTWAATPGQVCSEAEEGLAQNWEVQWQDFLKAVHTPHWVNPELPKTMRWEVTKSALVPSKMVADLGGGPPREEVGVGLLPSLKEGVLETCHDLESEEMVDGRDANKQIPSESVIDLEARRQLFRLFRYQEAEGPRQVCSRLYELCHQWLMPEKCTKEQILEALILEQFLAVLPPEMQSWVREGRPESCYQAVVLAEDFLMRQEEAAEWEKQVVGMSTEMFVNFYDEASSDLYRAEKEERSKDIELLGQDPIPESDASQAVLGIGFVASGETEGQAGGCQAENWGSEPSCGKVPERPSLRLGTRKKNSGAFPRKSQDQKRDFKRYQRIHAGFKLHICTECGQSFTRKANLFRHQQLHTGQKLHFCTICRRSFTRRENLVRHQRIHTAGRGWRIEKEGELLQVTLEGTEASEGDAQGGPKREEKPPTEDGWTKCMEHPEGAYFEFTIPPTGSQGTRKCTCPVCGKSFTRRATLNRHRRMTHPGENQDKGTDCGKSFSQGTRSGRTPYQGAKWEGKTPLDAGFNSRKRNSKGRTWFRCLECDRSFGCHSHLLRHQRIHTGEKPYSCADCGKSFRQTAHLVKHQRTHRDQKEGVC
ncbi:uncharacterized protein LOC140703989 isoform X1 [Pogona vitticeps]